MSSSSSVTLDSVRDELRRFLEGHVLAPDMQCPEEARLADLGVDSFALMEIILFVERRYQVSVPLDVLTPENVESVASLSACLHGLLTPSSG